MLLKLPEDIRLCIANHDPLVALRMLHLNRETKRAVEQNLYRMIMDRFIPSIVGLPHNLKQVYYVRLLRNYFLGKPKHPPEWRPMDSAKMGPVLLNASGGSRV